MILLAGLGVQTLHGSHLRFTHTVSEMHLVNLVFLLDSAQVLKKVQERFEAAEAVYVCVDSRQLCGHFWSLPHVICEETQNQLVCSLSAAAATAQVNIGEMPASIDTTSYLNA